MSKNLILIPLFPYMALAAALKTSRHLLDVGVHLATRASSPARYLVYLDRSLAHAEYLDPMATKPVQHQAGEVKHDDSRRFRVWGRNFFTGWCSAEELDKWKAGKGNVAIRCVDVQLDAWLRNAANDRHVIHRPAAAVAPMIAGVVAATASAVSPPYAEEGQELEERRALRCFCGRAYTWAEYLALPPPVKCTKEGASDQVESADEDGHPVIGWIRDCECKNTMCRPKPQGAR